MIGMQSGFGGFLKIDFTFYNYNKYKNNDVSASASLSKFTDAGSVSDWAVNEMRWAVATGMINGMTETTLVPQGTATRAQVATMLTR